MRKCLAILLAGILALAGCAPPPHSASAERGSAPELANSECGADKLADYANQFPTTDALAKIQQAAGHDRIRTIRPRDAVTMDFRPDRLNVDIGDDGRIKRFRCG